MSIESFFYMVEIRLNDIAIKIEILIVNLCIMISKTSEAIIERFIIQIVPSVMYISLLSLQSIFVTMMMKNVIFIHGTRKFSYN